MKELNEAGQALGRLGRGKKKTMTRAAILARRKNARISAEVRRLRNPKAHSKVRRRSRRKKIAKAIMQAAFEKLGRRRGRPRKYPVQPEIAETAPNEPEKNPEISGINENLEKKEGETAVENKEGETAGGSNENALAQTVPPSENEQK